MKKEFKDFTENECFTILNSIINNEKHTDEKKTFYFLNELKKIEEKDIDYILKYSQVFYYKIKDFFNFDRDEKMFYIAKEVQEYDNSSLTCCLQVLNYDNVLNVINHSLSLEHFFGKYNLDKAKMNHIKLISDYFFATGNLNIRELNLIFELIKKNKRFAEIVSS